MNGTTTGGRRHHDGKSPSSWLWHLVVVVALLPVSVRGGYGQHDLFTSLAQLKELWINELAVVDQMQDVIQKLEKATNTLKA